MPLCSHLTILRRISSICLSPCQSYLPCHNTHSNITLSFQHLLLIRQQHRPCQQEHQRNHQHPFAQKLFLTLQAKTASACTALTCDGPPLFPCSSAKRLALMAWSSSSSMLYNVKSVVETKRKKELNVTQASMLKACCHVQQLIEIQSFNTTHCWTKGLFLSFSLYSQEGCIHIRPSICFILCLCWPYTVYHLHPTP